MLRSLTAFALLTTHGFAQDRIPSHCIAIAEGPETLWHAAYTDPVAAETVRITYLDHAMFMLQTEGGLSAVTDYTGYLGSADFVPTVATMNHAHSSHMTSNPDPRIPHVLEGWGEFGEGVDHHLELGEMLVRNVQTNIRLGMDGVEDNGNSIFIFEVAGLCIGHLGHLHHEPSEEDYARIGRLDVVFAPVDGGRTLDLPTMIKVLGRLRSSVVIPMHWFGEGSLARFLIGIQDEFAVEIMDGPETVVSLKGLPQRPTVVVLRPEFLK